MGPRGNGHTGNVFGISLKSNHIDGSNSMVTVTCVCKQEPCQVACSKHAGRFVAAPFTWTVGKHQTSRYQTYRSNWRPAAGTLPRRCWDKLEVKPHHWFNQHGHGNLRMQARAVPSCMQQACGPFRHRTFHMDSRKHQTSRYQTDSHAMVRAVPAGDGTKRN